VPTFLAGGVASWGDDATDVLLNYLDNSSLFDTVKMKQISNMLMGLTRTT